MLWSGKKKHRDVCVKECTNLSFETKEEEERGSGMYIEAQDEQSTPLMTRPP